MSVIVAASPVVRFVGLLAGAIWVGGFVAIVVVARIARAQLGRTEQIAFFRALGRRYGIVGGSALLIALAAGALLLDDHGWDATAIVAAGLGAALLAATAVGVAQARRMTRLRQRAAREPDDELLGLRVARGARRAAVLRSVIGALTLALVALAAVLA